MKCPRCGTENRERFEACRHCGLPLAANEAALPPPANDPEEDLSRLRFEPEPSGVEELDDALEVGEEDFGGPRSDSHGFTEAGDDPLFRIDDDLFAGYGSVTSEATGSEVSLPHPEGWSVLGADLTVPAPALADEKRGAPHEVEQIIDRDDEVPERYWAPEVAGIGRRALALLLDHVLMLAILGLFFLGALMALHLNGLTSRLSLSAGGLQAAAPTFALLATLLSLSYSIIFHGSTGRTPGKALVGIEVRTGAGGAITWGRALLRWFGAALGAACAGVGIFWAVFEPRRRGWADLLSGTVVARVQRESAREVSRR